MGPAQRVRLAREFATALAEIWPAAVIVIDAPPRVIARRLAGVRLWDGWLDPSQLSITGR